MASFSTEHPIVQVSQPTLYLSAEFFHVMPTTIVHMSELFGNTVDVIVPIALCVLTGYALALLKLPFDTKMFGALVKNVGYPTLIISHLSAGHIALSSFFVMASAALAAIAIFIIAAVIILKLIGLPLRPFIAPMSLNNVGNIGLPVATLTFGDAGLSYSFAFLIVVMLGVFTYGSWVPSGDISLKRIATSPPIYAIIIALVLLTMDWQLPKPMASAFQILGGLSIPLMLLILGYTLATLNVTSIRHGAILACAHLIVVTVTGFCLASLFGFTGVERGIFILMCLMPVSVSTYLFTELYTPEYRQDAASLILVSTLLTVFSLPAVMTFGLQ